MQFTTGIAVTRRRGRDRIYTDIDRLLKAFQGLCNASGTSTDNPSDENNRQPRVSLPSVRDLNTYGVGSLISQHLNYQTGHEKRSSIDQ